MRTLSSVIALALLLVPGAAAAQSTAAEQPQGRLTVTKLGCFSLQRAFNESSEGKAGLARITALPGLDITPDVIKLLARK